MAQRSQLRRGNFWGRGPTNKTFPSPRGHHTLKEWQADCPEGELSNGSRNVRSITNIWKRLSTPIQIDCGKLVDKGEKDETDQPILEPKYGFHALRHGRPACLSNTSNGRPSGCRPSWDIARSE